MNRKVISLCLSLGLMFLLAGCAGKNVSSSSGDQSSKAKPEAIQPDAIKTVPPERSEKRGRARPGRVPQHGPDERGDGTGAGEREPVDQPQRRAGRLALLR